MRARDLGVVIGDHPTGAHNAITDVPGVRVGHVTLDADGPPAVHTGVTMVVPHDDIWTEPVFAGAHRLNGSGELTGLEWIRESGELTSVIGLTNTHSVGVVRDELVAAQVRARGDGVYWSLPVVGETYDGLLNDINGFHVRPEHARAALENASAQPPAEGNVGGGTGMICHGFKGGIGTSSRITETATGHYTVGVLVQANHGRRERLRINGVHVGELIGADAVPLPDLPPRYEPGSGSIIVIVATDAPLLPTSAPAWRNAPLLPSAGSAAPVSSTAVISCWRSRRETAESPYAWDEDVSTGQPEIGLRMVAPQLMTRLFDLTIDATEEAIVNAMVSATTMTGRHGFTAHAIDHDLLRTALSTTSPRRPRDRYDHRRISAPDRTTRPRRNRVHGGGRRGTTDRDRRQHAAGDGPGQRRRRTRRVRDRRPGAAGLQHRVRDDDTSRSRGWRVLLLRHSGSRRTDGQRHRGGRPDRLHRDPDRHLRIHRLGHRRHRRPLQGPEIPGPSTRSPSWRSSPSSVTATSI